MERTEKKSLNKKICKIILIVIASIVLFLAVFVGSLNIFKHFYYEDYFNSLTKVGKIAGLGDGFVPQGLTYYDDFNGGNGGFISAGYLVDGKESRLYAVDGKTGEISYYTLTSNGKPFYGHTGGLQYESGSFYLADESLGLYSFNSSIVDNASSGDSIEIGHPIRLVNNTCFVFTKDGYLYAGEFNNNNKYKSVNHITYNNNTNNAIITKYKLGNFLEPIAVYSIPNEIQGFAITDDGSFVLSRSYSVSSSDIYIYSPEDIIETDLVYVAAPVYFLDKPTRTIKAPAMAEDLDIYDGKVITIFESACNKYYFGKFFFANYIAGLNIDN